MTAYGIFDAMGECLALTEDRDEAIELLHQGHAYYAEAASCGHPTAPGWVAERMPLTVRLVDAQEVEEIRDEGTPTLQREP